MPKLKVERGMDYKLQRLIRGEMAAQGVDVQTACKYAGVCQATVYKMFNNPSAYMDKALLLMRKLNIPIEEVREAVSYPY